MNKIATTIELRQKNRRELLELLIDKGETTRNDLKDLSGFSYTTIGNLLSDLQKEDFIVQQGEASSTGGRKAQVIKVNPHKAYFIAVDVSGKSYKWGLYDLEGKRSHCSTYEYIPEINPGRNFQRLMEEIHQYGEKHNLIDKIRHMGVVISGYYISEMDKIKDSYDDEGLATLKIKELASRYFSIPLTVKNDAKVAAYYEIRHLIEPQSKQLFYMLVLKESFGSALVLNGQVYQGNQGYAGEIYPLKQIHQGKETTIGDLLHPAADLKQLSKDLDQKISEDRFFSLFQEENPAALHLFEKTATAFAKGILQILCVLNPSDIRIGGFYNFYGERLIQEILNKIQQWGEEWQYEKLNLSFSDFSQYTLIDGLGSETSKIWLESLWLTK